MTLAERFTFGDREHVALRMGPCQSPRLTNQSRHEFLRLLHPSGFHELRAIQNNIVKTRSVAVGHFSEVDAFATMWRSYDIYVGVATRATATGGKLEDCSGLHALFADQDFKDFPSETAARAGLAAFPLRPSIVVASGGGLHSYWLLREPLTLQQNVAPRAKQVLRALATTLGGDLNSAEPVHVLRLPGTHNHKYTPSRPVVVELCDATVTYPLADLVAVLGPPPALNDSLPKTPLPHHIAVAERMRQAREWLLRQDPAIQGQGGDNHTFVCCCVVHDFDLTEDQAFAVLQDWNARCEPPWVDADLRKKIQNANRYAEGARGNKLQLGVTLADFYAYMPMRSYLFIPTRESWPAGSVNTKLPAIVRTGPDGHPKRDADGNLQFMSATEWLDAHQSVEQMTWMPGEPLIIRDRLFSDGGQIARLGCACFNLYRPPVLAHGDPTRAEPWLALLRTLYPDDVDHIVWWLAHRVQRPHEKINHALLLGGAPGIGKDTLLEPVKAAIGPWNFQEATPIMLLGRFTGFLKAVILRISEIRDLGDMNRYSFYEHTKIYTAAPPDVLRVDEKNLREYVIPNVCGVMMTTNHKTDGLYLPPDDRRHYVAWSGRTSGDFAGSYWRDIYGWFADGGNGHVAALLAQHDLSGFDPKAPPPKTAAFWDIVDANRAPEDAELADAIEQLGNPPVLTLATLGGVVGVELAEWLTDRRNSRRIPHRLESVGYIAVRNETAKDGLWKIDGKRQVIYGRAELALSKRLEDAERLTRSS
jgi:hypothetical protein